MICTLPAFSTVSKKETVPFPSISTCFQNGNNCHPHKKKSTPEHVRGDNLKSARFPAHSRFYFCKFKLALAAPYKLML